MPESEEYPPEPTDPWTSVEKDSSSMGNIHPLTRNVFTPPGRPSCKPSHPTDTCMVASVKVAPGATSTMAPPAYHPYQMPMVHNCYTKAVENSDMPPPHFNGQLGSYDKWLEKLHQ